MAIYDPNIAFNRPDVNYQETFNLPVIDSSGLSKMLTGIADRADKSFKEITDAYDEYAKNSRDVLGFRLDNQDQADRHAKLRTQFGVDDAAINNVNINDFNNPYKMRDLGKRLNQVVNDYRSKDIIKEQASADTYRSQLEALRGIDPQMADVAAKQLDAYREGKVNGNSLNIKQYEPIDIVSDVAAEVKKIPETTISEISRDLEDLGIVYEDVKKFKSKQLITIALKSRLNDPVFKNNMIARGYYDPDTKTLTPAGAKFFEELADEHSKASNTIENVKNIPGFDIDGGTSDSSKSKSSSSSKSSGKASDGIDRHIFDGNSAADDRGRLFQDFAEKTGLDTWDEGVINMLKEVNGTYIASGENNSPDIAVNKGYNQILKYGLENAHADWYAIKAIRDFGYEGTEDEFLRAIADGTLPDYEERIGEFLDKVYKQESGGDVTTTDANGNEVTTQGVEYSSDGKTVTIRGLRGIPDSNVTIDHSKVFENLKKQAKKVVGGWNKDDIKVSGKASEKETDISKRFMNMESSGGKDLYSNDPDSSAVGDYHYLWNTHKNNIKSFLQENGVTPISEKDAPGIYKSVINKSPSLKKLSSTEKGWVAAWLSNKDLQKEFLEEDIRTNYEPYIDNTIIPKFGNILSNKDDWYYLVHYFGPSGLQNYLSTGKHLIKNGTEDNTEVAEKTIRTYDQKNGTNVWEEIKAYFKNKGTKKAVAKPQAPQQNVQQDNIDWGGLGN